MLRFLAALTVWFAAQAAAAQAHPHVWVTMKSEVVYDASGAVTGVRHAWTFDDMFSTFALQGIESKQKGVYTREELAPLAEVNISSLKEYDFFTYADANGHKTEFKEPVDYWLDYRDQILTLHFILPMKKPVSAKLLTIEVYDPSYFVDFSFAEKDAVALSQAPASCKASLGKPQEMTPAIARRLAEIPADQQIPSNTYGAQFANKIVVRC